MPELIELEFALGLDRVATYRAYGDRIAVLKDQLHNLLADLRSRGKTVAGFAAFKDHLSYLPFSVSVLGQLGDELAGYAMTKSSLHFPVDGSLPKALVAKLIAARIAEVDRRSHQGR